MNNIDSNDINIIKEYKLLFNDPKTTNKDKISILKNISTYQMEIVKLNTLNHLQNNFKNSITVTPTNDLGTDFQDYRKDRKSLQIEFTNYKRDKE